MNEPTRETYAKQAESMAIAIGLDGPFRETLKAKAIIWLLHRYAAEQREKVAQEKAPDLSDRG